MIRGFSRLTGYDCFSCHFKCCSTEYDLPLFLNEREILLQKYQSVSFFIQSKNEGNQLIRGDSCPFLTSKGLCILHKTKDKPLVCRSYPLIFWKINPELILCWIYPCRGNGFQWIADSDHQISDQSLNNLVEEVRNRFEEYWGDQIDRENPFSGISLKRIQKEIAFFENNKEHELIVKMANLFDLERFTSVLDPSTPNLNQLHRQEELKNIVNSVIHWLCWSPVGLHLSFENSKLLFYIAAQMILSLGFSSPGNQQKPFERDRYLQQLGSFLASAGMPSFWNHIGLQTHIDPIRRFSKLVGKVLSGEISQQEIGNFKAI